MLNKLLVASEYTDPSFHIPKLTQNFEKAIKNKIRGSIGVLLITKNLEGCFEFWEHVAITYNIPIVVHATITGLSGSSVEPNTPSWWESLFNLEGIFNYAKKTQPAFDPEDFVLRIDPIVPEVTDFQILEKIISRASKIGIKRCRMSIVDYYPHVRKKFVKVGVWHPETFQASLTVRRNLATALVELCNQNDMKVEACAEGLVVPGLLKQGCADQAEWARHYILFPCQPSRQRKGCFCNIPKQDLLPKESDCPNNCLYCYWGKPKGEGGE